MVSSPADLPGTFWLIASIASVVISCKLNYCQAISLSLVIYNALQVRNLNSCGKVWTYVPLPVS